jgi:hypothetical protein
MSKESDLINIVNMQGNLETRQKHGTVTSKVEAMRSLFASGVEY